MPSHRLLLGPSLVHRLEAGVSYNQHHGRSSRRLLPRLRGFSSARTSLTDVHTDTNQNSVTVLTTQPNVDIKSLEKTLQAHREVNRAPTVRKTGGQGKSVHIHDPHIGIPAINIKVPQRLPKPYKKVDLHLGKRVQANKGTSRDLDALWRVEGSENTLPLQYHLPWILHLEAHNSSRHLSPAGRIGAEIRAFEKYCCPTEDERRAAEDSFSDFVACVKEIDPILEIDIIGSRSTNLADPLSDIDVNVTPPEKWDTTTESLEQTVIPPLEETSLLVLDKLSRALRRHPISQRIELQYYVRRARVPVLLCFHRTSGISIQVQSTPRTLDSREHVRAALREYPTLKSLFKLIKQTLQMRGLTVGSSGGITSYPLFQMIVASLRFSEGKFHPTDVGNHFLFFLDFYSDIDFATHGISTEPLELFTKGSKSTRRSVEQSGEEAGGKGRGGHNRPNNGQITFKGRIRRRTLSNKDYLMTLQDPANPVNDLGKSCYRIKDVQETLIALRTDVMHRIEEWKIMAAKPGPPSEAAGIFSLLAPCIGGDYRMYEYERDDLRKLGQRLLESSGKATEPGG